MKIGLIARGDLTGLAVQTQAFYRHMNPVKTLVVDLSRHSKVSPSLENLPGGIIWDDKVYPNIKPKPDSVLEEFLKDIDVVFTCETPYNYWLFERARELGVKTVLQFNYEFLDYGNGTTIPEPDVFAAPSVWHLEDVRKQLPNRDVIHLPVPVDREKFPFKRRTKLERLLHSVGTGTGEDRNGTYSSIKAMEQVHDAHLVVRSQNKISAKSSDNVSFIKSKVKDPSELYDQGDCLLMPRKFGGLCLPMNEALSCGMPVLVSDCEPQSDWVPEELRIPVSRVGKLQTRKPLSVYECSPKDIASKINWLYDSPSKVEEYSEWADSYAESISWKTLKPVYLQVLSSI